MTDLHIDPERLPDSCHLNNIARLVTLGNFVTGDAGPKSVLDLLVTFRPEVHVGLEFVALQQELEEILGRPFDLLTRASVERSPNKYFRRFALRHTEPLYES